MKTYIEPDSTSDGKRIYCVVANRVQAPLTPLVVESGGLPYYERLVPLSGTTITVVQPPGRALTQAAHVVSRVRDVMTKESIMVKLKAGTLFTDAGVQAAIFDYYCEPLTTITLAARDSYELNHVFQLLKHFGVKVHDFHDSQQKDYGSLEFRVRTAIATEPVYPEEVMGILDYLPLWEPEPKI